MSRADSLFNPFERKRTQRALNPDSLVITFQAAGRQGAGKGPGVIGHGEQQRCGEAARHELLVHGVATRAPAEDRRVEEGVVVLRHLAAAPVKRRSR